MIRVGNEAKTYLGKNGKIFGPFSPTEILQLKMTGEWNQFLWICTDVKTGWLPLQAPPPPLPSGAASDEKLSPLDLSQSNDSSEPTDPVELEGSVELDQSVNLDDSVDLNESENMTDSPNLDATFDPGEPMEPREAIERARAIDLRESMDSAVPLDPPIQRTRSHPGLKSPVSEQSSKLPNLTPDEPILAICHNFKVILSGTLAEITSEGCLLADVSPSSQAQPLLLQGARVFLSLLRSQTAQAQNIQAKMALAIKYQGYWQYRIAWSHLPEILVRR